MITFDDIKRANSSIKTTAVQGKDYAEVNQRIKAFRMLFPAGFITTELKSVENGVCIFGATVGYYDENNNAIVLGTGTAYEKEGSSFINKTSYIENCETSAVGRALGMAGLGIDTSVASAEEVQNARLNQGQGNVKAEARNVAPELIFKLNDNASEEVKNYYKEFLNLHGNLQTVLVSFKLKDINEVTVERWKKVLATQRAWAEKNKGVK
jgi:hypothetical protein